MRKTIWTPVAYRMVAQSLVNNFGMWEDIKDEDLRTPKWKEWCDSMAKVVGCKSGPAVEIQIFNYMNPTPPWSLDGNWQEPNRVLALAAALEMGWITNKNLRDFPRGRETTNENPTARVKTPRSTAQSCTVRLRGGAPASG